MKAPVIIVCVIFALFFGLGIRDWKLIEYEKQPFLSTVNVSKDGGSMVFFDSAIYEATLHYPARKLAATEEDSPESRAESVIRSVLEDDVFLFN